MTQLPAEVELEVAQVARLWSVTTLIKQGLGTSEPLVNWAVRTTARAAIDQRTVIAAMLEAGDDDGAVDHLIRARYRKTGKAMARGTEIHEVAEQIALGGNPRVEEHVAPYVEQYRRWLEEHKPSFLMAEAPVYNPEYGYAGTCDGVMELPAWPGRRVIFDYKTTEHPPGGEKMRPPFPEVALQLAAYAHATQVGVLSEQRYASGKRYYLYDPTARHEPMPPVDGAVCIVISPYDCLAVPVRIDEEVWRAFVSVTKAARFVLHTSKTLFGPPIPAANGRPPEEEE